MKNKVWVFLPYGVVFLFLVIMVAFYQDSCLAFLSSPFVSFGDLLNSMLRSDAIGLIILAYVLYIIVGLLPFVYLVIRIVLKKKVSMYEWIFMAILAIYLFVANYMLINSMMFNVMYERLEDKQSIEAFAKIAKYSLIMIFYMGVLAYVGLKFILSIEHSSTQLKITSVFIVALYGFFSTYGEIVDAIGVIEASNGIIIIQIVGAIVDYILFALIMESFIRLLHVAKKESLDNDVIKVSNRIQVLCVLLCVCKLGFAIVNNIAFLMNTSVDKSFFLVELPIIEFIIAITFACLSVYFSNAKKIKEENDLTI